MRILTSKNNQDPSFTIYEPSLTVHDITEKPNFELLPLNESQNSVETLKQAYDNLDTRYPYYTCWLFFMILTSGFFFAFIGAITLDSFKHYWFVQHFNLLGFLILMGAAFSQYIFEMWAIYTRDLAEANLALKVVSFNTLAFLGLNVLTVYNLYHSYRKEFQEDMEAAAFPRMCLIFGVFIALAFSLTQIFITHFQAIKVRNNLAKREEAMRINRKSISTPCSVF